MAKKYNNSLLSALNSVREGKDTPFVMGYIISKELMKKASNRARYCKCFRSLEKYF